jgi:hypothetical protein
MFTFDDLVKPTPAGADPDASHRQGKLAIALKGANGDRKRASSCRTRRRAPPRCSPTTCRRSVRWLRDVDEAQGLLVNLAMICRQGRDHDRRAAATNWSIEGAMTARAKYLFDVDFGLRCGGGARSPLPGTRPTWPMRRRAAIATA